MFKEGKCSRLYSIIGTIRAALLRQQRDLKPLSFLPNISLVKHRLSFGVVLGSGHFFRGFIDQHKYLPVRDKHCLDTQWKVQCINWSDYWLYEWGEGSLSARSNTTYLSRNKAAGEQGWAAEQLGYRTLPFRRKTARFNQQRLEGQSFVRHSKYNEVKDHSGKGSHCS